MIEYHEAQSEQTSQALEKREHKIKKLENKREQRLIKLPLMSNERTKAMAVKKQQTLIPTANIHVFALQCFRL